MATLSTVGSWNNILIILHWFLQWRFYLVQETQPNEVVGPQLFRRLYLSTESMTIFLLFFYLWFQQCAIISDFQFLYTGIYGHFMVIYIMVIFIYGHIQDECCNESYEICNLINFYYKLVKNIINFSYKVIKKSYKFAWAFCM